MTPLSGTFFLNVQCVLSILKSFYYDCLSIKCCIVGVASVVAFFYVANGRVYGRTISHKKMEGYMLRCSATSPQCARIYSGWTSASPLSCCVREYALNRLVPVL